LTPIRIDVSKQEEEEEEGQEESPSDIPKEEKEERESPSDDSEFLTVWGDKEDDEKVVPGVLKSPLLEMEYSSDQLFELLDMQL
jgi:hypothetical protein